jgi:hypothetical protein
MLETLIVAEGDSWFQLVKWRAIPSHLGDMDKKGYQLKNIAFPGDNFMDYAQNRAYLETINRRASSTNIKNRFLILSGGGNDLMKDHFDEYLDPDSETFLSDIFDLKLKQIEITYNLIFRLMEYYFPKVIILVHGYDYVIPREDGSYLGEKMKAKGIDPKVHGRTIMERVIDRFNDNILEPLTDKFSNAEHIDLRGICEEKESNWGDEIHPNSASYKKMAKKFHDSIQAHIA